MKLTDHQFAIRYTKAQDDIANDFYLPCMRDAKTYDRISGYFKSTIFLIAWGALKEFVENGSKMRIICSPYISSKDENAATEGYEARASEKAIAALNKEINEMFENDYLKDPSRVLACLIAKNIIDIKIAVGITDTTSDLERLFHEKSGVFTDEEGNAVAFAGSMNETLNGLSNDGNIEAIDVFVSWLDERDKQRVDRIKKDFELLWSGSMPKVKIFNFPDETKEILAKHTKGCDWEKIVDRIIEKDIIAEKWKPNKKDDRKPRDHQTTALEGWLKNNRRGIFEHATGSGKTFTALCAINNAINNGFIPVILVPSKELLQQWNQEVKNMFSTIDIKVLLCGDGNNAWRNNGLLYNFTTNSTSRKKAVIATMDTASTDAFINGINKSGKLFLVADEVHRLGSSKRSNVFSIDATARLGLSATPKRSGDPVGTKKIFNYFGGIIEPPFTLKNAIDSGVLTPYYYYPKTIVLLPEEQEEWNKKTLKISQEMARVLAKDENANVFDNPKIQSLLLSRARILKNAKKKVSLAVSIISDNFESGQKWIVYCDNKKQLYLVLDELKKIKHIPGLMAYDYHSAMQGDREQTLKFFESNGGVLVSIKCLDEGVDIPSTTHALILASSKNPREFIQRRGRILRRAEGKKFAYLYDAIVVPFGLSDTAAKQETIVEAELARAIQFGDWALNRASCTYELKKLAIEYDIDIEKISQGGLETDDDEE